LRRALRGYNWRTLAGDMSGGLVAALIALPYGLAMASLMGLPPEFGLVTSLVTAPLTALLGCNPVLIGGTSSVTVPFIAAAVREHGVGGAAKVSLLAAVIMLVFSVLHLGRQVSRIPAAVIAGFSCGIGAMMVISQLRTIFGLPGVSAGGPMAGVLVETLRSIGGINWTTAATAATVMIAATVCARWRPHLPAPLLGIVAAVTVSLLFGWSNREIGALSVSLPPLARFSWEPSDFFGVLPEGFGLALVTTVNLLATSRVVEHFRGRNRDVRRAEADREVGAYGIANLAAGLFGAPVSVGIPARSLANVRSGATTRVSNVMHAGFLLLFATAGATAIGHIPVSALAGVTAWMGFSLMNWSAWKRLPKMRRVDAAAFVTAAAGVLLFNAVAAILAAASLYAVRHAIRGASFSLRASPELGSRDAG
jgi:SulP family sulfate permease